MDTHSPRREDDLNEFERRLARWRLTSAGTDADAMLYAAGCQAGRHGRSQFLWPPLCSLCSRCNRAGRRGVWQSGLERQALASQFAGGSPALPRPDDCRCRSSRIFVHGVTSDYVRLRGRLEQDLSRKLALAQPVDPQLAPPPPGPPILKAGQRDGLLDQ